MSQGRQTLLIVAIALLATASGAIFYWWRSGGLEPVPARAAHAVMGASLEDLSGRQQPLSQWRGKALVVNFWATWCPPCREEIPEFIKAQDKYRAQGLQFVGIAIDRRDAVEAFVKEMGINYPVLLGGVEAMELTREAGNRAGVLPFTLVIDRSGKVVGKELGKITRAKLEHILQSLLRT
ncbi:MAG: TlpA family protein disulfide reductase [Betaproteobacteria bacterium]|nr:TlpA family protein disulfide reductase [Betaproteobacteria bacterium]